MTFGITRPDGAVDVCGGTGRTGTDEGGAPIGGGGSIPPGGLAAGGGAIPAGGARTPAGGAAAPAGAAAAPAGAAAALASPFARAESRASTKPATHKRSLGHRAIRRAMTTPYRFAPIRLTGRLSRTCGCRRRRRRSQAVEQLARGYGVAVSRSLIAVHHHDFRICRVAGDRPDVILEIRIRPKRIIWPSRPVPTIPTEIRAVRITGIEERIVQRIEGLPIVGARFGVARVESEVRVPRRQCHFGRAPQKIILDLIASRGGTAGKGDAVAIGGELLVGVPDRFSRTTRLVHGAGCAS